MDLGIKGNTALVTGGASGIGLATAKGFIDEGCSVLLWDISSELESVAKSLHSDNANVDFAHVDILDFEKSKEALESFVQSGRKIDHVVHCAAIGSGYFGFPFFDLEPENWRRTIEVNIMGTTNIAHTLTPHLIENNKGTFVILASVAGQIGSQTDPPYSASKAANINFAQCMAKDLAKFGIRVNTVCPGMVKTPLNRSVWQSWADKTPEAERLSYEDWAEQKIKAIVPLGRWQECQDIASMIVFLSSARAGEVTGQTINVDGGFVMHW